MTQIVRKVEICPKCGCWNPFRKGNGRTMVDRKTGLRRVYGACRKCGEKMVVRYVGRQS